MIPIGIGKTCVTEHPPHLLLAGDIGGTKSDLALYNYDGNQLKIVREEKYPTKDYKDPVSLLQHFLGSGQQPDRICLGVAGPVIKEKASVTNVPWTLDSKEISTQFNNIPAYLINDLEANACGLAELTTEDLHTLHEGKKQEGNMAVIAPGTGLGEAGLYWDGEHYHPFATEGGHCDFSPNEDIDDKLLVFLRRKFGHVSWERVLSGPGILNIFEFLREEEDMEVPAWLMERMAVHDIAAEISENATTVPICVSTMQLFFRFLAIAAGNLALKMKASGGIFIGGGIIPKNIKLIDPAAFRRSFRNRGRMRIILEEMPIHIILNEKTALMGAAWYAINKC